MMNYIKKKKKQLVMAIKIFNTGFKN